MILVNQWWRVGDGSASSMCLILNSNELLKWSTQPDKRIIILEFTMIINKYSFSFSVEVSLIFSSVFASIQYCKKMCKILHIRQIHVDTLCVCGRKLSAFNILCTYHSSNKFNRNWNYRISWETHRNTWDFAKDQTTQANAKHHSERSDHMHMNDDMLQAY